MASFEFLAVILTGLGLTASIVYYANILNNANKTQQLALETRQTQLFMQILFHDRDKFARNYSKLIWEYQWNDFDDFWEKYGPETNMDEWEHIFSSWGYFQNVGILVQDGLVPIDFVEKGIGSFVINSWEKYEPIIVEARKRWGAPNLLEPFEYLKNKIQLRNR